MRDVLSRRKSKDNNENIHIYIFGHKMVNADKLSLRPTMNLLILFERQMNNS